MLKELSTLRYRKIGKRNVEWFSEHELIYPGAKHMPNTCWPTLLLSLMQRVIQYTGVAYNSALVNFYKDGSEFIPWHSDNSNEDNRIISSLSFCDTRIFHVMDKATRQVVLRIPLEPGSLAIMSGEFQHRYLHSIPKSDSQISRYNITFRLSLSSLVV